MRIKILIEYDGTGFAGWQRQDNANSVQETLERAIEQIINYQGKIILYGAGRTDAGVHATGQVAHFDFSSDILISRWQGNIRNLVKAINFYLIGTKVIVLNAEVVPEDFHARFSAKMRHYEYIIFNRPEASVLLNDRIWHVPRILDIHLMQRAATYFIGRHNLGAFRSAECSATKITRNISSVNVTRIGAIIAISVSAQSFLHHQVRIMVGTLKMVGDGKYNPEFIWYLLAVGDRRLAGPTAPSSGLYLRRIDYVSD
ncbi:MAG: tRNA pseudouridine(38-40) synthase TruA [Holosporales bacterium]|jgi:tRNA pseudouridine38-40 synthase|nr:tRNA pseudouridine(38-40) synthase TruA [Holosporales bacterium]